MPSQYDVRLIPMTDDEFRSYLAVGVAEYADEHIKAGSWSREEGYEKARQEYDRLLPQGVATPNHYFYSLVDVASEAKVGMIWYHINDSSPDKSAFIYDIRVYEEYRRRGYGSRALALMEEALRAAGVKSVALHVFAHNAGAREMYQKLGFEERDILMRKSLGE